MPEEHVQFHDLHDLHGISAVEGRNLHPAFPRHAHGSYIIGLVDAGIRNIETDEGQFLVRPGELFAIEPGRSHRCRSHGETAHAYKVICLAPSLLGATDSLFPTFANTHLISTSLSTIIRRFFSLLPATEETRPERRRLLDALVRALGRYMDKQVPTAQVRKTISRIRQAIDLDPATPADLQSLAREANLSPCHFQRAFLKETGMSPREYIEQRRIRISRLLLNKGESLTETALACGFADQSHFTKAFRRVVGVPPGKYRLTHAGKSRSQG